MPIVQAHLIAAAQNLKRLLSNQSWGRRPCPDGAVGIVLPTVQTVAVRPW